MRELYYALEDLELPPDIPIIINTLQDVLFMDQINDISFAIGDKLVILIEHQSTINPNMCLRLLLYISRVYEKIVGDKNMYGTSKVFLPQPEFFVLYNGEAEYTDEKTLKLSEMYREGGMMWSKEGPFLELIAKVININAGRNNKIVKKSATFSGYSLFVRKAREYKKESGDLKEGLVKAIKYCREHGVLEEYFTKH